MQNIINNISNTTYFQSNNNILLSLDTTNKISKLLGIYLVYGGSHIHSFIQETLII